jgi:hypothetical protein
MSGETFRRLAALGLTVDQIAGVVDIIDEKTEQRRAKGRERWHKWNEKKLANVSKQDQTLGVNSCAGDARGDVKQNNLETPNSKKENSAPKALSDLNAFKAELTSILDDDRISALCGVRKQKKAGFSDAAGRALAKKLSQFPNINSVVDEMIVRGWVGIDASWLNGRNLGTPTQKPKSDYRQHQEAVKRKFDEFLGIKKDDNEPAGSSPAFDLEPGNWSAH